MTAPKISEHLIPGPGTRVGTLVTRFSWGFEIRDENYEYVSIDNEYIDELIRALQEMKNDSA